ncbi:MAG: DUF4339 domain-containing protein [Lachnospiraceae bacterium]|nr:DUF4339 domain-containing protein [Lachnospiraceae bacterium]
MSEQKNWYYLSDTNEQVGPFSESQIPQLVASGAINGLTRVWTLGMNGWIMLKHSPLNQLMSVEPTVPTPVMQNQKKAPTGLWIALGVSLTIILAMAALIAFLFLRTSKAQIEGPGFDSPKAAAEAFSKAYSEKDIDGMYAACALESYVKHFDLEKYIENMQAYTPAKYYMFGNSDATATMNEHLREWELTRSFYNLYETPLWNRSDYSDQRGMSLNLEKTGMQAITDLLKGVDALNTIEVKRVETVSEFCEETGQLSLEENFMGDANQNRLSKWKEMYGGEVVDMAVSMNIDGDHYYLFLQAISYDNDKWYVFNTHGMLASLLGLDANSGGLCLTSEPGAN